MIEDAYLVDGYYPTIGIECHVQLKTKTKLFAGVDNDARQAEPNTLISHICLGMPGALPVLNKHAIELAAKAAFALSTQPQSSSKFDRKHYFYPDLPMGYQITQYDEPIILGGSVTAIVDGVEKSFDVTRAHLEADAGKSTHPANQDYSLVDLNRAGTPLLEIVSEPCIHNASEAKAYAHELYLLMKYADVSDVNLFYGNMRFDVNVSVSKDPKIMGTRTETKNLNSFRSVFDAVNSEIKRQISLLENGEQIIQETRGWNDDSGTSFSQRSKEDAHDYRYFPDPDIPPISLSDEFVEMIKQSMPTMPHQLRVRYTAAGIDSSMIETLLDEVSASQLVNEIIDAHGNKTAKTVANWLGGPVIKAIADNIYTWQDIYKTRVHIIKLASMVDSGLLSSSGAKEVLQAIVKNNVDPQTIAEQKNLLQESDSGALEEIVANVIKANEKAAQDVANGEMKAIGFLVGQVMKSSGGKANPAMVQQIIKTQLGV
ncbi:Asp-tRNA(Asn)/Glu-tRNA(Gln) amidotransferase subunit GatB [bacterium]|nr:Asp-tRNA(Asn)/Glu-tRNA(Gln) amidotransferase subunit GatB [bacterium]NBX98449.1 Asp-tRNA(Asn)/Glu-tRNA(Gln) amidotransferase subunit GatB [bacterium]NDC94109.1 Asp-tRNA(Asn)/Glu-tRNA(Gln) amidotransferase subunit GatB [bacterium]NDD83350.1 Asp-tRNA(Asn)/Glu-tRNA(Gln) amidotransferase subunit GatB [bacterium]NDG28928.1 Asp-tRNA(Asn)/Glu-tRNA(Gln) amidotransferase subunit GatB [bacterium]